MHKNNALRFMAKSHSTSLSPLSIWLGRAFSSMMPVSEEIWRKLFLKVGIITQSSWVIINNKQVQQRMAKLQQEALAPDTGQQQTYDFSTMHTKMKLSEVKNKMARYVELVFEYKKQGLKKPRCWY